jgi:hypothetical protein
MDNPGLLVIFYSFWIVLNLMAWFSPKLLLEVLAFAKPESSRQDQTQKELREWYKSPGYIWHLRIVLLIVLIVVICRLNFFAFILLFFGFFGGY